MLKSYNQRKIFINYLTFIIIFNEIIEAYKSSKELLLIVKSLEIS